MFCLYITKHPLGRYYVGKSTVERIQRGYMGGGTALNKAFKKYPRKEWVCEVVQTFETEREAYDAEAFIVNERMLADPMSLNLRLGGRGGLNKHQHGMTGMKHKPETIEKMRVAHSGKHHSEEHKQKLSLALQGKVPTEEQREKMRVAWTPERRAKQADIASKRFSK